MERALIAERVLDVVADVLGRRRDEVRVDSRLMRDLGAESLDYLDIVFQLEDRFGVRITRGELQNAARGEITDEDFAPGGVVSDAGLARLRTLLPEAAEDIRPGLRAAAILSLFSVETFVKIVEAKLAGTSPATTAG